MVKILIAAPLLIACFAGCGGGEQPEHASQSITPMKVPIDSEAAIEIAKAHLRKLGHPRSEDRVKAEKQFDDLNVWWVTFTSEPPVPGGHTVVKMNIDGTGIDMLPGA